MDDDLPVGCEDLHRAKLAREARKEANRQKAQKINRYNHRNHFKGIMLRKEWDQKLKNRLRNTPGPGQAFCSTWLPAQQVPTAKSVLIIIIEDDNDDDDEVVFLGTGQVPAVDDDIAPLVGVDDNPVVTFLSSLDPNT